jgi:hypothetical protein
MFARKTNQRQVTAVVKDIKREKENGGETPGIELVVFTGFRG